MFGHSCTHLGSLPLLVAPEELVVLAGRPALVVEEAAEAAALEERPPVTLGSGDTMGLQVEERRLLL